MAGVAGLVAQDALAQAQPTVTLAFTPSSISENGGVSTVTASLSGALSSELTMTVSVYPYSLGGAVAADITQSGTTLTIAAGQTSSTGTVTVTAVNNDEYATRSESFRARIDSLSPANVQQGSEPSLTITDDEAQPTLTWAFTPSSISENGGVSTVTASLSGAVSSELTMTVSVYPYSLGGAVAADITQSGTTLTIAAGQTSSTGTVTVTAVNNDEYATRTGSFRARIDSLSPANVQQGNEPILTITDDEAQPTLTWAFTPSSISENGGVSTVTASLSGALSSELTMTVSVYPYYLGGAVAADITQSGTTLTIAAGQTSSTGTVTVTAVNNDEYATRTGSFRARIDSLSPAMQQGNEPILRITDDEAQPTLTWAFTPSSISENGGVSTVTASLSGALSSELTMTVSVYPYYLGGAVAADITQSGTTLTIAAGQTSSTGTVTVTAVNNDEYATRTGSFRARIDSLSPAMQQGNEPILTITDDEAQPTLTWAFTPSSISENGGVSTVTASLSGALSSELTMTVIVYPYYLGGAVAADITQSGTTLTIAAGQTSSTGTVTVTAVNNDEYATRSGSFRARIDSLSPANVQQGNEPILTITDDEAQPTLTWAFTPSSISENGGVSTVTASLSGAVSSELTMTVSVYPYFLGGAVAADITQSGTTLTIAAGQTSSTGTVTVTAVNNDEYATRSGSFRARIDSLSPANVQQGNEPILTITDDEAQPTLTWAFTPSSISENGGVSTVTASLSGALSSELTMTVSVYPYYLGGAVAADITQSGTTLTIAAGQTSSTGTVTVTAVNNDEYATRSGSFRARIDSLSPAMQQGNEPILTITDDEAQPTLTWAFTPSSISENGGVSTVTASLSGALSSELTMTVSVYPYYLGGAVAADITQSGTTLTIAAGQTSSTGTVTVTAVNNDEYATRSGSFRARIDSLSPAMQQGSEPILTITDDEAQPTLTWAFTPSSISENGGVSTVTASLSGALSSELTMTVSVYPYFLGGAVAADITQSGTTLTIAAGQTSSTGTVTVTAVDNGQYASRSKSFRARIDSLSPAVVQQGSEPSLTITDDEAQPTMTLAFTPSSISENGGVSTVTASLSGALSVAVTVTVSASAVSRRCGVTSR